MIKGTVDTTPLYERVNASSLLKFSEGAGTTSLSVKNTITTATHKYIEHKTPNNELNLNALAFLGIDIGSSIKYEYTKPQK